MSSKIWKDIKSIQVSKAQTEINGAALLINAAMMQSKLTQCFKW